MRRGPAVLVVGTLAVGVGVATGGPADAQHLALRAVGTVDAADFVDGDGDGRPSAGDRLVQHETLRHDGRRIGELTTACDIATATRAVCTLVWRLPGGFLTGAVQATDDLTAPLVVAVSGGTGRYRTAAGTVRIVNDPAHPAARDTEDFGDVTVR